MMSVAEYALDVNKTVEEILKQCKVLGIDVENEDDMLDDYSITELDNAIVSEEEDVIEEEHVDVVEEEEETATIEYTVLNIQNFVTSIQNLKK